MSSSIQSPSEIRELALQVFKAIYAAVESYRADGTEDPKLHLDAGICYNIERFAHSAHHISLLNIKENLIRQTPSYSGEYHYPVKSPTPDVSAERAWDRAENKWHGEYGALRLQQLGELIHLVEHKWEDCLVERRTPAQRHGLKLQDIVRRKGSNELLRLVKDDDSAAPGFAKMGRPDNDYDWISLDEIVKVSFDTTTVAELIEKADENLARQKAINEQIAALNELLSNAQGELTLVDYQLASVHKVRRLA